MDASFCQTRALIEEKHCIAHFLNQKNTRLSLDSSLTVWDLHGVYQNINLWRTVSISHNWIWPEALDQRCARNALINSTDLQRAKISEALEPGWAWHSPNYHVKRESVVMQNVSSDLICTSTFCLHCALIFGLYVGSIFDMFNHGPWPIMELKMVHRWKRDPWDIKKNNILRAKRNQSKFKSLKRRGYSLYICMCAFWYLDMERQKS